MAGKFVNTRHNDIMISLNDAAKNVINHANYKYTEASDSLVTYYSVNFERSNLDPNIDISYDDTGRFTAIKYDKINKLHILGIPIATLNMDIRDTGIESSELTNMCSFIPNTITPHTGDFFKIDCLEGTYLFEITNVQIDTLPNGQNSYQSDFTLYSIDPDRYYEIDKYNIADEYICIFDNIGTDLDCLVRVDKYEELCNIDEVLSKARELFISTYYTSRVQSFIFSCNKYNINIYDPYTIEFLMSTNILFTKSSDDIYVQHLINPGRRFPINYNRSIMVAIIERNIDKLLRSPSVYEIQLISQMIGMFASREEKYFTTIDMDSPHVDTIEIFPAEFIQAIKEDTRHTASEIQQNPILIVENIINDWMHRVPFNTKYLKDIEWLNPQYNSSTNFYYMLFLVFILDRSAVELLTTNKK